MRKLFFVLYLFVFINLCFCTETIKSTKSHRVLISETIESGSRYTEHCFYEVPSNLFEIKNRIYSVTDRSQIKLIFPYMLAVHFDNIRERINRILSHHPQQHAEQLALLKAMQDLYLTSALHAKENRQNLNENFLHLPHVTQQQREQFTYIIKSISDEQSINSSFSRCGDIPFFLRNWPFENYLNHKNTAIGIVELPNFLDTPQKTEPLTLYLEPRKNSPILDTITNSDFLVTTKVDYKNIGALVYKRKNGWSLVRFLFAPKSKYQHTYTQNRKMFGWLAPHPKRKFHALTELYSKKTTYLTKDWNRILYSQPSLKSSILPFDSKKSEIAIDIIQTKISTHVLWLEVEIVEDRFQNHDKKTGIRGWVPAHSASDFQDEPSNMQVWFYTNSD